ncbi:hypothetical protein [Jeotgalibacillus salarius]|uniref:DUF4181 domain-containing protein n=1 Tax=Jeotgalibacillus salarius TaxID=546023 RepID=A0A4Y8LKS8_9BACL|nr:hypothetical protein [Jeotgalibacillus salarius]TFE02379.1 hypothetical protein E2626_07305 [Jeotgalibacillus salarius]
MWELLLIVFLTLLTIYLLDKLSAVIIIKFLKLKIRKKRGQTINGYHTAANMIVSVFSVIILMVIHTFTDSWMDTALYGLLIVYLHGISNIFIEWKYLETDDFKVSLIQMVLFTIVALAAFPFAADWLRNIEV